MTVIFTKLSNSFSIEDVVVLTLIMLVLRRQSKLVPVIVAVIGICSGTALLLHMVLGTLPVQISTE